MAYYNIDSLAIDFEQAGYQFRIKFYCRATKTFTNLYPSISGDMMIWQMRSLNAYNNGSSSATAVNIDLNPIFNNWALTPLTKNIGDLFTLEATFRPAATLPVSLLEIHKSLYANDPTINFGVQLVGAAATSNNQIANTASVLSNVNTFKQIFKSKLTEMSSNAISKQDLIDLAASQLNCDVSDIVTETRSLSINNTGATTYDLKDGSNRDQYIWIIAGNLLVILSGAAFSAKAIDSRNADLDQFSILNGNTGSFNFGGLPADKLTLDGTVKGTVIYQRMYRKNSL